MTFLVQSTNNSTGLGLDPGDTLFIAPSVLIAAANAIGVYSSYSGNINNYGTVTGVYGGIKFGQIGVYGRLYNGESGIIDGGPLGYDAVNISGPSDTVNYGQIKSTGGDGVSVNAFGSSASVLNFGSIYGSDAVNDLSATGYFDLVNHGTISSDSYAFYGAGLALETIINTGIINGNISLGEADGNSFDSSLGLVFGNISGGNGSNTLIGGRNDNRLYGHDGSDVIRGGAGSDFIKGGNANDLVFGDDGDDSFLIYNTEGNDSVDGGAGVDYLDFDRSGSSLGLTFSISDSTLPQAAGDGTTIVNIERLTFNGGSGDDNITGGALVDTLYGNSGSDTLNGGGGVDALYGGDGDDVYFADLVNDNLTESNSDIAIGGDDLVNFVGATGTYVLGDFFERLTLGGSAAVNGTGNALANTITGNGAANQLMGGGGMDIIHGGGGNDFLSGDGDNDQLFGDDGDDTFSTYTFEGSDAVDGGAGVDIYFLDRVSAVINLTFSIANSAVLQAIGDGTTLVNIERLNYQGGSASDNVTGGAFVDTLFGHDGADTLNGGGGVDVMIGGNGNDIYYADVLSDVIYESNGDPAVGGADTVNYVGTSGTYTLGNYIENLTLGGVAAINGTGNELANTIVGNANANVLNGGNDALVDVLVGGDGNDTYELGNNLGDLLTETTGVDTITSTISRSLADFAAVENLTLLAGALTVVALNGTGNALANFITGNENANTLNGGVDALADTLVGGLGNDIYVINTSTDNITEAIGGGTADRAQTSVSFVLAVGDNIEFLETTNAAGAGLLNLTGNEIAQTITGNAGANILNGGIDAVVDTLIGGLGNDIYVINTATDNITEAIGGGTADRARASVSFLLAAGDNIEFLETTFAAGTGALNLAGNEIAQTIIGNAGSNVINGMLGNDILTGGLGSDFFVFNTLPNAATNRDTITDYNVAADTIRLENTGIFTALGLATGVLNATMFKNLTTGGAVDASDRILYNDATGQVFYDVDGSGAAAQVLFATITGAPTLTNLDFVVI